MTHPTRTDHHLRLRGVLVALAVAGASATSAEAQVVTFQQGVGGYTGAVDLLLSADFSFRNTPNANGLFLSVQSGDDNDFPTQGVLQFNNLFADEGGPIPVGAEILFAEIEVVPQDETSAGARVSFNRVQGPDLNRRSGSGVWSPTDTWNSLGGNLIATGNPPVVEEPFPIDVDTDEAFAAPESFDGLLPRGVLPRESNIVNINEVLAGARVTIDVTDSLQAWSDGAENLGWAINNDESNDWDFVSSDFNVAGLPDEFQRLVWENRLDVLDRTEAEVRPLLRVAFGSLGDTDGDGDLDGADFDTIRNGLGSTFENRGEPGDLDFDRDIDLDDFARFKSEFIASSGVAAFAALTAVPEPGSVLLAAVGLAALTACRRR